ncbi:MAG: ADP-ribose pyrophosphatase [Acidimicrobiales bacterium]|nr:ADP-ribose pyrophosphatase [Acidimicrobiales bacterium]
MSGSVADRPTFVEKLAAGLAESAPEPEAIPAATVILLRDGDDGVETLMLHRNDRGAFGGMWVFPGGRVDPADLEPDHDERAGARRGAVRETLEEAGLVIGADDLIEFSHWVPPPAAPKRFSTWIFVAAAPGTDVTVDGTEIHDHDWVRPADAISRRDAGEIELAPPTWVSLWRLSSATTVDEALGAARRVEAERFETHIGKVDDDIVAVWRGDAGYDDGDLAKAGPRHRLWMLPDGWRYERSD